MLKRIVITLSIVAILVTGGYHTYSSYAASDFVCPLTGKVIDPADCPLTK